MNGKDMARNPKTWLASQLRKLTPEEMGRLEQGLLILGGCLIAKPLLDMWPSIPTTIIKGVIVVMLFVLALRLGKTAPLLRGYRLWFIPLGVGAFLNWLVVLVNGGYMPAALEPATNGIYIPMAGSNLPYLGDWVFGFISPGDVLVFVSLAGLILTIMANGKKKKAVA